MKTNSSKSDSFNTPDKVYLGAFNLKRPLLIPFLISLVILTTGNVLLMNHYGVKLFTLVIFGTSFALFLISMLVFRNLMAEAYLKQDNFVVKYLRNKQAKVMCVKCVRKIQTFRFLGFCFCLITFKLDGVKQKALVFGSASQDQNPKQLILQAKSVAA
ncbi:MAG: hypothetical protein ACOVO3_03305 [Fluviicola sp.]|jgi:hypothetical protein